MRGPLLGMVALVASTSCSFDEIEHGRSDRQAGPGQGAWTSVRLGGLDARLYVPPGPAPSGGRGLMVVLHGCAQRAVDIGDGGNWGATADGADWIVLAPDAPGGGVLFGCWDYYGANHSRTNRHTGFVLALVRDALARGDFAIDPNRVYVSGLSSGAGQAMVLGCVAPDVFAGVGLNAGPTIGTGSGDIARVATTQSAAVSLCRNLAGTEVSNFSTQLVSIVYANDDFTVATGYNRLNADVFANLYGVSGPSTFNPSSLAGARPAGRGWRWSDGQGLRVELIENTGLGHNWPSGAGGGSTSAFVQPNSLDYPERLSTFFEVENRRTGGNRSPVVELSVSASGRDLQVNGRVTDDGQVSFRLDVTGPSGAIAFPQPGLMADGRFSTTVTGLADGSYTVSLSATDDAGQTTRREASAAIGAPPPPPPGVTATLTDHISAGRLSWAEYGTYYLRYGTAPFTLYAQPDGSWSDVPPSGGGRDAGVPSDAGPADLGARADTGMAPDAGVSPDLGGAPDSGVAPDLGFAPDTGVAADAGASCQDFEDSNYAQVVARRAEVCSFAYVCTVGSGERLGLYNTFARSTVRETAPGYFEAGACP